MAFQECKQNFCKVEAKVCCEKNCFAKRMAKVYF